MGNSVYHITILAIIVTTDKDLLFEQTKLYAYIVYVYMHKTAFHDFKKRYTENTYLTMPLPMPCRLLSGFSRILTTASTIPLKAVLI